jgi:hypothetical protein
MERRHEYGQDGETRVESSDEAGVIIYSVLMIFLMLSWAYIPA